MSIRFQNEPILDEQRMENILNSVSMFPLILHPLKFFTIVSKKKSKLDLKTISFISLFLLVFFFTVIQIHDYNKIIVIIKLQYIFFSCFTVSVTVFANFWKSKNQDFQFKILSSYMEQQKIQPFQIYVNYKYQYCFQQMFKEQYQSNTNKRTKIVFTENKYKITKEVGAGTFGKVYEAFDAKTGQRLAIKEVFQDKKYKNRELDIISVLHNNNIVQMKDYYFAKINEDKYLYLVMDFFNTNLQIMFKQYRKQRKHIDKLKRKILAFQLFKALYYFKEKKVCHRDLKPSNILIDDQTFQLKVCDFGSAKIFATNEKNVAYICSRYYRCPQLLFNYGMYGTQIDVWSAGCILVQLLTRQPIFPGDSALEQIIQIFKVLGTPNTAYLAKYTGQFENDLNFPQIPHTKWERVLSKYKPQPQLVDLISKILVYDPAERLTPFQILTHPYFHDLPTNQYKQFADKLPNLFVFDDLKFENNHKQIQQFLNLYTRSKLFKPVPSIQKEIQINQKTQTADSTPMLSLDKLPENNMENSHLSKKQLGTCDTIQEKQQIQQNTSFQVHYEQVK